MSESKVSVPLSYLENLIRDGENLKLLHMIAKQALVDATAEVEKLQKQLESFKRVKDIPVEKPWSPPEYVDKEVRRLFVAARGYPESLLYSAYAQIRQLLEEEFPNNRISAIKKVRELTGCGLKEAKEFCEGSSYLFDMPKL